MGGKSSIPTSYSIATNSTIAGGLDLDLDEIRIKELPEIIVKTDSNLNLTSNSDVNVNSNSDVNVNSNSDVNVNSNSDVDLNSNSKVDLKSDSKVDLGLDNLRIKELPTIDLQLGLKPMRFSFPLSYKLSFSLFGKKIFDFKVCGENMAIVEDYKARKAEQCK